MVAQTIIEMQGIQHITQMGDRAKTCRGRESIFVRVLPMIDQHVATDENVLPIKLEQTILDSETLSEVSK